MTGPAVDRPSIPLSWGERDRFDQIVATPPPAQLPARLSPRAGSGVRRVLRRLVRSPFAAHLRAAVRAAFWPTSIGSGVVLALVVLTYLQSLTPITGGIR